MKQTEIINLLTKEFSQRRAKNPAYSIRSFARFLDINPGALSQYLNFKRPITKKSFLKMADKLMILPDTKERLLGSSKSKKTNPRYQVPIETYHIVSDWHYYAILSLMETSNFQHSIKWIADRLSLTRAKVESALELLIKLGYVEIDKNSKYKLKKVNLKTTSDISHMALKRRQHRNLEDAQLALQQVETELREFCSMTMAIDPERLPMAKNKIRNFIRELSEDLEQNNQTEVYELAIQLFPRTNLGGIK